MPTALLLSTAARMELSEALPQPTRRTIMQASRELDDGVPVETMPWLHWFTLRIGEGILAMLTAGIGYELWTLGCSAAQAAASIAAIG